LAITGLVILMVVSFAIWRSMSVVALSRRLRASESRINSILNATEEGIYGLDLEGNCTFSNAACARMLGYENEEKLTGKNMHDLLHHTHADGSPHPVGECPINKALQEGREAHVDNDIFWKSDGTSFPTEYWTYPVRRDVELIGSVVTFININGRKEVQAQLIQTSKLATLGELAASTVHEINQPLSIIGMAADGALERLKDDDVDKDMLSNKLTTIASQTERLAAIVNHMGLFSRKDDSVCEWFDACESVHGAIEMVAEQYHASGIKLEVISPRKSYVYGRVRGHPHQLEQVLLNLLSNARKATLKIAASKNAKNGAFVPTVRVSLKENKANSVDIISISNNGGNIPYGVLKKIFDPFFTTERKGEGTGLGLSISRDIIRGMNGIINVYNTEGGVCFTIILPVAPGKGKPRGRTRRKGAEEMFADNLIPDALKGLIVENEKDIADRDGPAKTQM